MDESEYHRIAAAEDDHWWYRSTRGLVRELLAPWLRPGLRAIDVGAGPGGNGAWLAAHGTVTALDVEPVALAYVRHRRPELQPVRGSATALPFASGTIDLALVLTVLYHVADDTAAVAEVRRVLRPGGVACFVEPAFPSLHREHDVLTHGLRRYRRPQLAELVRTAGLEPQRATYAKSFLFPPAALLAGAQRLRGGGAPRDDAPRSDLEPRGVHRGRLGQSGHGRDARSRELFGSRKRVHGLH